MDDSLREILIAVAAVGGAATVALRNRATKQSLARTIGTIAAGFAAAGLGAAIAIFGLQYLSGGSLASQVEEAMKAIKELPLVGLVISENPAVEGSLRQAVEADIKDPVKQGPARSWHVASELRVKYILPTMRNADDASVLSAIKLMNELAVYLQAHDVAMCRELGAVGLQHGDKMDRRAQEIFKRVLASQEVAYRNGKAAKQRQVVPSDAQLGAILLKAGFSPEDLQNLGNFMTLPTAQGCAMTVKLYDAPSHMAPAEGAPLARWMLTISPQ